MSVFKSNKKHRSDSLYFSIKLLTSDAYLSLSGASIKVLNFFYIKKVMRQVKILNKKEWEIVNNGQIVFTYPEAVSKGFTRPKFKRALKQLVEHGFIDLAYHGGGMAKDKSLYSISERWKLYGKDDFIFKTIEKDNRKLGFKKGHKLTPVKNKDK
jgi:hypothetical protein